MFLFLIHVNHFQIALYYEFYQLVIFLWVGFCSLCFYVKASNFQFSHLISWNNNTKRAPEFVPLAWWSGKVWAILYRHHRTALEAMELGPWLVLKHTAESLSVNRRFSKQAIEKNGYAIIVAAPDSETGHESSYFNHSYEPLILSALQSSQL